MVPPNLILQHVDYAHRCNVGQESGGIKQSATVLTTLMIFVRCVLLLAYHQSGKFRLVLKRLTEYVLRVNPRVMKVISEPMYAMKRQTLNVLLVTFVTLASGRLHPVLKQSTPYVKTY
jgi:hypothetical protein